MSEAAKLSKRDLEEGSIFAPKFDEAGLIGAIVTDAAGGGVLMFAYMNAEALRLTAGDRRGAFLEPVAAIALAQGRNQRQQAAGPGDANRLRSGCTLA